MNKKEAWRQLKKLWKKMLQHFKDFYRSKDPEQLHRFRVQVKKIRSLLTLLEYHKKNGHLLKTFKPVKKIFKSAGVIRDALLHQQQAKKHKIQQPKFYEEQDRLQKEATEKLLRKKKEAFKKIKKVKKRLHNKLHAIPEDEIKTFFSTQLRHTERLLNAHNFSEELHDGRKMLKHLMYNEQVIRKELANELNIDFKYVDEMQELLGEWHDNKLALDFFLHEKPDVTDLALLKQKSKALEKNVTDKSRGFEQKISTGNPSTVFKD